VSAEPQVVWMPGGVRTEVHLGGEQTGGAFCLLVDEPPAVWSLGAHRHVREAETIHVVRGAFEVEVEGARRRLAAGETIHIPRGCVHRGANVGDEIGRRVVLFSPAGLERFFLESGSPAPGAAVDWAAVAASAARHGWEVLTTQR
jgi:quercetin dioxygenase-like cupin family protein